MTPHCFASSGDGYCKPNPVAEAAGEAAGEVAGAVGGVVGAVGDTAGEVVEAAGEVVEAAGAVGEVAGEVAGEAAADVTTGDGRGPVEAGAVITGADDEGTIVTSPKGDRCAVTATMR